MVFKTKLLIIKNILVFYDDYVVQQLLPRDTELLAVGTRVNAFYSPRKLFIIQEISDLIETSLFILVQEGVDADIVMNIIKTKLKVLEKIRL